MARVPKEDTESLKSGYRYNVIHNTKKYTVAIGEKGKDGWREAVNYLNGQNAVNIIVFDMVGNIVFMQGNYGPKYKTGRTLDVRKSIILPKT